MTPQRQTVSFFGVTAAATNRTYLSQKITSPFKTSRIRAAFPSGTNRLHRLRFYIVGSTDTPTTEPPVGTNILMPIGQVDFVTGDDNVVDFQHEIVNPNANVYIAVYSENLDVFEHTVECQVTVEFLDVANQS